jgi:hypothetical protein
MLLRKTRWPVRFLPRGRGGRGADHQKMNKFTKVSRIIPYNPKLKILAKKLRKDMTFGEVLLWNE